MNRKYKHKAMNQLKRMIDTGILAPDVNIRAMYKLSLQNAAREQVQEPEPKKQTKHISNKPRFHYRASSANYRARKNGKTGIISSDDLEAVYAKYNGVCNHCGGTDNLVFDHIISYYKDGDNTVDNLQLLCRICNMLKGAN